VGYVRAPEVNTPEPARSNRAGPPEATRLSVRAARSSLWSVLGQVLQALLSTATLLILSRWLGQEDYGLVAMAATVSGFLGMLGDSGIGAAIIRRPTVDDADEATAFWLAGLGGLLFAILTAATAPVLARFYGEPSVLGLAVALAVTFVIAAPGRISAAQLSRAMRFRTLTLIQLAASAGSLAIGAWLAARGAGAWALVAQLACSHAILTCLTILSRRVAVSPRLFSLSRAREFARFGSRYGGFSLAILVGRSLEGILAGRLLGAGPLGLLGMATRLVGLPVHRFSGAISTVLLPAVVELDAPARQAAAFASATRLTLMVVAPFCLGGAAVASEAVALLPPRWSDLAPVLAIQAAGAIVEPVGYLALAMLTAQGRAGTMLRVALLLIPLSWAAAVAGAFSGSIVVLAALTATANAIGAAAMVGALRGSLGLGLPFLRAVAAPVACAGIMAMAVRWIVLASGLQGTRTGFVVGTGAGLLLYPLLLRMALREETGQALRLVGEALGFRPAPARRP
jgi:PST family polysaccharide transporter